MSAIVVQARGLVGLNFTSSSMENNNLLKDVFKTDLKQAHEYTKKYYKYFIDIFVAPYKGLFKELIIENHSEYGRYSKKIRGTGKRNLHIVLQYINL